MLNEKREEIRKLTLEILDMMDKPQQALEIKKKITSILSLINSIASYSNAKNYDVNRFTDVADSIFELINEYVADSGEWSDSYWSIGVKVGLEKFCNYANSIRFDFTKRDFKIHIPKIEITIFKTELK